MILVTGGAGFIGANFVLDWLAQSDETVINLDILSYAGNRENLASLAGDERHVFVHGDDSCRIIRPRLPIDARDTTRRTYRAVMDEFLETILAERAFAPYL